VQFKLVAKSGLQKVLKKVDWEDNMSTAITSPTQTQTFEDPNEVPIDKLPAFGDIPPRFWGMIGTECANCRTEQEVKMELVIIIIDFLINFVLTGLD
jgi:hypothetical protein